MNALPARDIIWSSPGRNAPAFARGIDPNLQSQGGTKFVTNRPLCDEFRNPGASLLRIS
jgi:hypothetical protein